MTSFQTDRFLKDIKHVDKDLRLMALFDLRRFLPNAEEDSIQKDVVEKTLACLSPEERCEEVQNEAANVLPVMVVRCQQREMILQHLLSSVAAAPSFNESEMTNLRYLCGMAFKKSCAEFAEEARRNVLFWQKELNVARALCSGCAGHLTTNPSLDDATREIMYSAVNALVSAYRDALEGRAVLVTCAVQDFQSAAPIRHASLTLVESLMASVDAATQEKVLNNSLSLLLGAKSDELYVSYLQLCETELKALPVPPRLVLQRVFNSVCERLRHAAEQYDGAEDSSEILMEVLDSLLQLRATDCDASWEKSYAAVKDLVSFDPYYTGANAEPADDGDGYDDEYDEYYDYNNEVSDSTWKLRMRAMRVLRTLVAQYDDEKLGVEALTMVAGTLQDRIELVQLEGVKLIRAVARRAYAREGACATLVTSRCTELCGLLECGEEKMLTAVAKALEEVFEAFAGDQAPMEVIAPLLLAQVRNNAARLASNAGAVESLRSIVSSVVSAADSQPISSAVIALSAQLPALCAPGARSEAAAAGIVRVSRTLSSVYAATHDAAVPAALGNEYKALVGNTAIANGCRVAAVESLAWWIAACGLALFEAPAAALWAALDIDALRLPALRALHTIASSAVSAAAVPAAVWQAVEELLSSSQPSNVRVAAAEALLARLSVRSAPALDAGHLQRLTQLYASSHPLSLTSCELGEMRALALLLQQLFQLNCDGGSTTEFYTPYISTMWDRLTQLASAVAFSRSLLDAALEGVTSLLAAVYARETAARPAIERDVVDFLTRDQAYLMCSYALVRCIAADAVNSFLAKLFTRIASNGYFLLCLGEAGKESALEARWCTLLLDSVTSKQGEEMRTCGEVALSYCMLNPANTATVLIPCCERAAEGSTVGRYYYVKAVKEAATLALPRRTTAFHEPAICERLLTIFLSSTAGNDLEELYGACVGVLSTFRVDGGATPRIASILFSADASLNVQVTCMVALRYFLSALVERGASVEVYRAAVIQALLRLRRPANVKESTAPSLPLRSMALRLLTSVLQHHPQWLLCEAARTDVFPNLLAELREDGTLQGTIDLSGYTHRVDKGLECRKLAFESLSAAFWAQRQHNVDLMSFCDVKDEVVDALIVACSPHNKGDRDSFINDTAKELLMRFVGSNPDYVFTTAQLDALVDKLSRDIKSGASASDAQKTTLLITVKCVMRLSSIPLFAYHAGFQEVAEVARTSVLLAQSLKM